MFLNQQIGHLSSWRDFSNLL